MLVASDQLTDKDYTAVSKVKGDLFMLAGATLYGFSQCGSIGTFETPFANTHFISERRRRVLRAQVASVRGRGSTWDVGYTHQRHPGGLAGAQGDERHYVERRNR